MKHKVGDLVVLYDLSNRLKGPKYHLGYISNVRPPDNYYIYFFNMEKEIWYSEHYVDAFKQTLKDMVKNG